jgi:thiamine-phosphate pyrophosphorylase
MNNKLKLYLITDPQYYSNNKAKFQDILEKAINKNHIDFICFRDKESANYKELAKVFVKTCKNKNIKNILLNSNYTLASKLKAFGVHLRSNQFEDIQKAKDLGLYVIISCHTEEDINKVKLYHANAISYSPIFDTPNKGKAKGIEVLKEIVNKHKDINIFALGGIINKKDLEQISQTSAYGFASIRYFI